MNCWMIKKVNRPKKSNNGSKKMWRIACNVGSLSMVLQWVEPEGT